MAAFLFSFQTKYIYVICKVPALISVVSIIISLGQCVEDLNPRLLHFQLAHQVLSCWGFTIISCDQEEGVLTKELSSRLRLSGFSQASQHSFLRTTLILHMSLDLRSLICRVVGQVSLPGRWVHAPLKWQATNVAQLYRTVFYVRQDIPCRVTSIEELTRRIFHFQLAHQVFSRQGSHCEGALTKGLARRLSLCVSGHSSLLFHCSICWIFLYDI